MARTEDEDAAARVARLLLDKMPAKVRTAIKNDLGERGEIGRVNDAVRRAERLERKSRRN